MADNILYKIATKQVPAEIIFESSDAVSVLDVHPIAPGHTLVLPTSVAKNILDLDDGAIDGVFRAVKATTALLQKALRPDGFTIGINHGLVSGQSVDHLHIHIIPRFSGDGGSSIHAVVSNVPKDDIHTIGGLIRAAA
jgi:histidine triad (HIT) family protein